MLLWKEHLFIFLNSSSSILFIVILSNLKDDDDDDNQGECVYIYKLITEAEPNFENIPTKAEPNFKNILLHIKAF